jgi:hypothetical protein
MAQADENLELWRALSEKLVVQGDDRTSSSRPTAEELDRSEAKSAGWRVAGVVSTPALRRHQANWGRDDPSHPPVDNAG